MSWLTQTLTSSIGRKLVMSLTGLFLCSFLVVHLGGNLCLFIPDDGLTFNAFTNFMEHNIIIRILEIGLLAGFVIHIVQSIIITIENKKARPVQYEINAGNATSSWASRNMGILGTIIFIFLIIHLRNFFWDLKFNDEKFGIDGNGNIDLYTVVVAVFQIWYYSLLYVIAMLALGYHLWHGFQSAFQTLGIRHKKYTPIIKGFGFVFTLIITIGFISMPVYFYFQQFFK
jgi:succinate dehydrogenase / fumarate reductase, cytochrome b subunit